MERAHAKFALPEPAPRPGATAGWTVLTGVLLVIGAVLLVALGVDVWRFFPNAWPVIGDLRQSAAFADAQVAAANDFLSMLLTLLVGLFVVVGASISGGFSPRRRASVSLIVLLGGFGALALLAAAAMIYARVALLYQITFGAIDLRRFVELAGLSAVLLGGAFVAAVAVAGHALLRHEPGEEP